MAKYRNPISDKIIETINLRQRLLSLAENELAPLFDESPELVEPLLALILQQEDVDLVKKATLILKNLRNPHTQEAACWQSLDTNDNSIKQLVLESGYLPIQRHHQALYYFLTEQWAKYETLDFDQSLLKTAYDLGTDKTRRQIAQAVRANGKIELLSVLTNRSKEAQFASMSYLDWELAIDMLTKAQNWSELWQWAKNAPPRYSIQIMRELALSNWQPANQQAVFHKLLKLAQNCKTKLPPLGRLLTLHKTIETGYTIFTELIKTIVISPVGNLLACRTDYTQCLELWDISQGTLVKQFTNHFKITASEPASWEHHSMKISYRALDNLAFSADGQTLACGDGIYIWLIKVPSGEIINVLEANFTHLNLAFSQDDTQLIGYTTSKIKIWDLSNKNAVKTINPENDGEYPLFTTISPNTKFLAGKNDKKIWVWEVTTGKLLFVLPIKEELHESYFSLYFSNDSHFLIAGKGNYYSIISTIQPEPFQLEVAFSSRQCALNVLYSEAKPADLEPILVNESNNLQFWHMTDFQYICSLDHFSLNHYRAIVFSPDRRYIVTLDSDGNLYVWTSQLSTLAYQTPEQTTLADLLWVQEAITSDELNPTELEKEWLRYIEALLSLRFEHEIELDEPMFKPTEFDIEIQEDE